MLLIVWATWLIVHHRYVVGVSVLHFHAQHTQLFSLLCSTGTVVATTQLTTPSRCAIERASQSSIYLGQSRRNSSWTIGPPEKSFNELTSAHEIRPSKPLMRPSQNWFLHLSILVSKSNRTIFYKFHFPSTISRPLLNKLFSAALPPTFISAWVSPHRKMDSKSNRKWRFLLVRLQPSGFFKSLRNGTTTKRRCWERYSWIFFVSIWNHLWNWQFMKASSLMISFCSTNDNMRFEV